MSPQAEEMLLHEIVPRFHTMIPTRVSPVGHEDCDELIQDCTVMAVKMLESAERRGKKVTAGNIAHYTVLHARCGRRSYAAGSQDVLNPIVRMGDCGEPQSFEDIAKEDEFGGEPLLLADVLTVDCDDPATKAARKIDWDCFVAGLSDRCRAVVEVVAEGGTLVDAARKIGRSTSLMPRIRDQIADQARQFFGADILNEIVRRPGWNDCLEAGRQSAACRYERLPA